MMKNKHTLPEKNQHWIDRLIIFGAFVGGFLLSSSVYSFQPAARNETTVLKGNEVSSEFVLEENLVRREVISTEEALQEKMRQDGEVTIPQSTSAIDSLLTWGIDFSPTAQPITIQIFPEDQSSSSESPIEISFLPNEHCEFGDGRACIYKFSSPTGKQILLASAHSGVGAVAEEFRNFIEGTGFNQGYYNLNQVTKNAQSLEGSPVIIQQGEYVNSALEVISILRIPPEYLDAYMALPVEQTIVFAAEIVQIDPAIFNHELLIFETCGWQLPDEDPIEGHTYTSSSLYLGIIGLKDN